MHRCMHAQMQACTCECALLWKASWEITFQSAAVSQTSDLKAPDLSSVKFKGVIPINSLVKE